MTYADLLQIVEALRLQWLDLIIPLVVFGLVYAANKAGLANTSDRKRLAGALAALSLAALRTVLLGVFGSVFNEVVEIVVVGGFSWIIAAFGYEAKETIVEGMSARKK